MRIESCRRCGMENMASKNPDHRCVVCRKPTKSFCQNCNTYGEVQFHPHALDAYITTQLGMDNKHAHTMAT